VPGCHLAAGQHRTGVVADVVLLFHNDDFFSDFGWRDP
jgi:hypothetical protein